MTEPLTGRQMMTRCVELAGYPAAASLEPADLIGLFQRFRPDGQQVGALLEDVVAADDLIGRLRQVYQVAGDPTRPSGGLDAYFIVRGPAEIEADYAEVVCQDWLQALAVVAAGQGKTKLQELITSGVTIRVLEGKPPKHPRSESERSALLNELNRLQSELTEQLRAACQAVEALRTAYYFIACDGFLRDYLMWPIYRQAGSSDDPFAAYFLMWRHGIKFRTFSDETLDLYLPRHPYR